MLGTQEDEMIAYSQLPARTNLAKKMLDSLRANVCNALITKVTPSTYRRHGNFHNAES